MRCLRPLPRHCQSHQRSSFVRLAVIPVCRRSIPRARACRPVRFLRSARPAPSRCAKIPCRDLRLRAPDRRPKISAAPRLRVRRNAGRHCSALPATRDRSERPRRSRPETSRRLFIVQRKSHLLRRGRNVPVQRALEPLLFQQHRMQRLRESADIVQRRLRDLAHFLQVGAQRRAFRRLLSERPSIEPIAVRTCPNSSCSSREMWRSVDSCVEINFCASSLRCSESAASRAKISRFVRIR